MVQIYLSGGYIRARASRDFSLPHESADFKLYARKLFENVAIAVSSEKTYMVSFSLRKAGMKV